MDNKLPISTPEDQGIPSQAILNYLSSIKQTGLELHGIMLFRNNSVVSEGYFSPYAAEKPHRLYSAAKAIIAVGILIAIQEGKLSLKDNLAGFFPEYRTDGADKVTLYHLLTMTAGHEKDSFYEYLANPEKDLTQLFFSYPFVNKPGTRFYYDNGIPHILMVILERLYGKNLMEFLEEKLFIPLGIENVFCAHTSKGIYDPATMRMTLDSLLRIAVMLLNEGEFYGKKIVDSELVKLAGSHLVPSCPPFGFKDVNTAHGRGYGFQMWRNKAGGFRMDGGRGQVCMILPESNLILAFNARVSDINPILDLFCEHVLSHTTRTPFEPDPEVQKSLINYLASMTLFPTDKLGARREFNRKYRMEENRLGIFTLNIASSQSGILIGVNESEINCGMNGEWKQNMRPISRAYSLSPAEIISGADQSLMYVSAGWTGDGILVIHTRFDASMDCSILEMSFSEGKVAVTISNNGNPEIIQLTGKEI